MTQEQLREIIRAATLIAWEDGYTEGFDDGDEGGLDPDDRANYYEQSGAQNELLELLSKKFPGLLP